MLEKRSVDQMLIKARSHVHNGEVEKAQRLYQDVLQAKKEYKLDLSNSILIGDRDTDLEAGKNAGINNLVKIRTNNVEDYIENILNV